jgi:hypothetical protein
MPYIKPEDREKFEARGEEISPSGFGEMCEHAGDLNYLMTRVCLGYIKRHGMRYQTFNDIVGVLTCMVHEFYRRLIGYYEDMKIVENGDILTAEEMRQLG